MSLGLKWVSYRQHIYGSCFCIHSASLCLLAGAFNPFTFKVVIDIYVPIAIFLIVWGWFHRSSVLSLSIDYIFPLTFVVNLVWWYWIFLTCLSVKPSISPSILNKILAGYSNLHCRFFPFSTLTVSFHSLLACRVSAERSAVKHIGFPLYVTCCFSLAAFNI